ncbi:hypothetical protein D3C85_578760 [compost metagenome]
MPWLALCRRTTPSCSMAVTAPPAALMASDTCSGVTASSMSKGAGVAAWSSACGVVAVVFMVWFFFLKRGNGFSWFS